MESTNQVRNEKAGSHLNHAGGVFFLLPRCRIRCIPSTERETVEQTNKRAIQASRPSTDSRKLSALRRRIRDKSTQVNCSEEFPLDSPRSLVGG